MSTPVTEQRNPVSYQIDTKPTEEILTIINNEDKKVPYAVEGTIPELTKLIDRLVPLLEKGGRLFYIGAGTSGRLGALSATTDSRVNKHEALWPNCMRITTSSLTSSFLR